MVLGCPWASAGPWALGDVIVGGIVEEVVVVVPFLGYLLSVAVAILADPLVPPFPGWCRSHKVHSGS